MAKAVASDRTADIRRIWGLSKEIGLDEDTLRDVAAQVTGVRNPETGEGSISRLGASQRRRLLAHLDGIKSGVKKSQERRSGGWLASPAQVKLIAVLHRELVEMGVLRDPAAFMKSQTGRTDAAHLPKSGRGCVSAQGYIEMLMMKKARVLMGGGE